MKRGLAFGSCRSDEDTDPSMPHKMAALDRSPLLIPCPSPATSGENEVGKKQSGRHSKFKLEEDLILIREIMAAKAHIASFNGIRNRFETAAFKANDNEGLVGKVT